jgi:hypothetical protein
MIGLVSPPKPTQPPIQKVPEAVSLGVKRPGREIDHYPLSKAEVKNGWSYTSIESTCIHGAYRDNFTPYFYRVISENSRHIRQSVE